MVTLITRHDNTLWNTRIRSHCHQLNYYLWEKIATGHGGGTDHLFIN
jgi:hypothetical protein